MTGPIDETPDRRRGAVLPPPSFAPEDAHSPVVPRMEPPPSSLEAMVPRSAQGRDEPMPSWLGWLLFGRVAVAIIGYVLR